MPMTIAARRRSIVTKKRYVNPYKDSAADVRVLVRRSVVAVQVEQPVILVLTIITTNVQHNAGGVVVAIIAPRIKNSPTTGIEIP